jgi:hypothetical protein
MGSESLSKNGTGLITRLCPVEGGEIEYRSSGVFKEGIGKGEE